MTPDTVFLGAGTLAFAGSFVEASGFPSNGYAIVGGTIGLALVSSTTNNTKLQRPVMALALLTLMVAVYVYIPGLTNNGKPKKITTKKAK